MIQVSRNPIWWHKSVQQAIPMTCRCSVRVLAMRTEHAYMQTLSQQAIMLANLLVPGSEVTEQHVASTLCTH